MVDTLRERLTAARRARFVGRRRELELFAAAVGSPVPPFAVLFVHGPAGIGKTALLDAFAEEAEANGIDPRRVDGRDIEPSPEAFVAACPVDPAAAPGQFRPVILVDDYERLEALDLWFREQFAPSLPADSLVVLAGRHEPSLGWRTAPGWPDLLSVRKLGDLEPHDVRAYLKLADVDAAFHDGILAVTHGHPLALSLVADIVAERGLGPGFGFGRPPTSAEGEMSREEFTAATRQALRDLRRPDALAHNPLARSRLVQGRDDGRTPDEIVSALLVEATELLFADPRDEKLQRVVDRTYLRPAPSQEKAAELLDLPFSTYRRHLTRATERIVTWMWDRAGMATDP